jgi:hypothetical protein
VHARAHTHTHTNTHNSVLPQSPKRISPSLRTTNVSLNLSLPRACTDKTASVRRQYSRAQVGTPPTYVCMMSLIWNTLTHVHVQADMPLSLTVGAPRTADVPRNMLLTPPPPPPPLSCVVLSEEGVPGGTFVRACLFFAFTHVCACS